MNAALETLMLVFSKDEGLAVPQRALFIGAQAHADLASWPEIMGWQPLKPLADTWKQAGFPLVENLPTEKWPLILVLPGKSRDETLAWFAIAKDLLESGGKIVVAMPNTAGAARFEKELAKATGQIASIQKHKCRAFYATSDGTWNEEIFATWRALATPRKIPTTGFTVEAGVFSSDHIDPGSQLLADHLPAGFHGRVADLGAGWGFLSAALLQRCPNISQLDLYEADWRALRCAQKNLSSSSAALSFHWHDVTTGLPGSYDVIVMNPPFHTGQATDIALGLAFIQVAVQSLKRNGRLMLVANRQLPYEIALEHHKLSWRKLAEDNIYKILTAEKR